MGNRLNVAVRNDAGDVFRILRQTDRDGKPALDFGTELREPGAERIHLDESEAARRANPAPQINLTRFDGSAIQLTTGSAAGHEDRQSFAPGWASRISSCVGAGTVDHVRDAFRDFIHELRIDGVYLVRTPAVSLREAIGRLDRRRIVPREFDAE